MGTSFALNGGGFVPADGAGMWDTWGTTKAAPGGASTPLLQGPRRLVKESTNG